MIPKPSIFAEAFTDYMPLLRDVIIENYMQHHLESEVNELQRKRLLFEQKLCTGLGYLDQSHFNQLSHELGAFEIESLIDAVSYLYNSLDFTNY